MATDKPGTERAVEAGRAAIFIGAAKAFFMVTAFLQKTLLTRLIDSASFGVVSLVTNFISVVNNATVQGTIQSVSKFTAEDDRQADAVKAAGLKLQFMVGASLFLIIFFAAPWIADLYRHPEFTRWFRIVALIPFIYSLYSVFVGSANGLRRFSTQAGFDIGFSTTKTILLLGGASLFGIAGALFGFVAAALVILVVAAIVMHLPSAASGEPFPMRRLLAFVAGYTLLINVALNYDILLLRRFTAVAAAPELANQLTAHYEAVRNLALLPYQALLVITFVIFPLVSRSTFQDDRAATSAYLRQTLRFALILGVAMSVVLAARPLTLLTTIYPAEYGQGAAALPILVGGVVFLSLLGVSGAIINASGSPGVATALVAAAVAVGGVAAFVMVPAAPAGPRMLEAAAAATSIGNAAGFLGAFIYLRRRFGPITPVATVVRVAIAGTAVTVAGKFLPAAGKLVTLGVLAGLGAAFIVILVLLGEFGAQDRQSFKRILSRRR
jgi:stage V sporulation protein B